MFLLRSGAAEPFPQPDRKKRHSLYAVPKRRIEYEEGRKWLLHFPSPGPLTVTVFRGPREEAGLPARLYRKKGKSYGYIYILVF